MQLGMYKNCALIPRAQADVDKYLVSISGWLSFYDFRYMLDIEEYIR